MRLFICFCTFFFAFSVMSLLLESLHSLWNLPPEFCFLFPNPPFASGNPVFCLISRILHLNQEYCLCLRYPYVASGITFGAFSILPPLPESCALPQILSLASRILSLASSSRIPWCFQSLVDASGIAALLPESCVTPWESFPLPPEFCLFLQYFFLVLFRISSLLPEAFRCPGILPFASGFLCFAS